MRLLVENLAAERGGETVFSNIDLALAAGEALVVTGQNGAGKSTLLQVIAGLLPSIEGKVWLDPASEAYPTPASALHFLGHQNAMKPALSVLENLQFWQDFMGSSDMEIGAALELVGLGGSATLPFATLSTGQRRRIAIARLLVSFRPIWLLDEPTAGLDAASERRFSSLMQAHCDKGGMIIAATHWPLGLEGYRSLHLGAGRPEDIYHLSDELGS